MAEAAIDEKPQEDTGIAGFLSRTAAPEGSEETTQEPSQEAKAEEKPPVEESEPTEEKPQAAETKAEEEAKPAEEPKAEEKPAVNWDADDNPYKKRYVDTHSWANALNQQNQRILRELDTIRKKQLDPDYEPPADPQPSAEQLQAQADARGRVLASEKAARAQFGEEFVEREIAEFNRLYGQNSQAQMMVMANEAPVYAALDIMKRYRFEQKWGNDVDKIEQNIIAAHEKTLTEKIRKEVTDEIMGRVKKRDQVATGLSEVKSAPAGSNHDNDYRPKTLGEILAQ